MGNSTQSFSRIPSLGLNAVGLVLGKLIGTAEINTVCLFKVGLFEDKARIIPTDGAKLLCEFGSGDDC